MIRTDWKQRLPLLIAALRHAPPGSPDFLHAECEVIRMAAEADAFYTIIAVDNMKVR